MSNTRIEPTTNGQPHLGHLMLARVNEYHARATGGELSIVMDDNQHAWIDILGVDQMQRYADAWVEDMAWAGITFDKVRKLSEYEESAELFASFMNIYKSEVYPPVPILAGSDVGLYPYAVWLTAEKVYVDSMLKIDLLIRGIDLMSEYALYQHVWSASYVNPPPQHVYLPRLQYAHGAQIDNVSKTVGKHKLATYREEGWEPGDIEALLRESCLVNPLGDWSYTNIKAQPVLRDHHHRMPRTYCISVNWERGG